MDVPTILYSYAASPYGHKVDNALTLKKIPHLRVKVSPVLPRPELADILGIPYRRIPVLAIGNDVYCDTSLIVATLERRFPPSQGFGTLFPRRSNGGTTDTGLIKAFSKFYIDNALFGIASLLLPWEKLHPSFVQDRSDFRGSQMNVAGIVANREKSISQLASHIVLLEEQLNDNRTWLFDTEAPGLADISVHFVLAWARGFPASKSLFQDNQFPFTQKWLAAMTSYVKQNQQKPDIVDGTKAGDLILNATFEPCSVVGFDTVEAQRLGVKLNETISIAPDDTGRNYPTTGSLVALSREEIVLEVLVKASQGTVKCHFPRLGYAILSQKKTKL